MIFIIYSLRGILNFVGKESVAIDCHGVAYELFVSLFTKKDLPNVGEEVLLYTYVRTTDRSTNIYGFSSQNERDCFLLLLQVSGVGPKICLSVFFSITPHEALKAISYKDANFLTKAQGVSDKLALRIVTELEKKARKALSFSIVEVKKEEKYDEIIKAVEALVSLGYQKEKAYEVVRSFEDKMSTEELIRSSLKFMSNFG
ncbi:MAG: Holliday junction branch migration protein RuvA [Oscillospiraceae bacterium]|jgi:Holliday junction DNA helicase RuvA|nr:Holliday junction branch migration protein RuvA [Oscillospiraceae bacterium]